MALKDDTDDDADLEDFSDYEDDSYTDRRRYVYGVVRLGDSLGSKHALWYRADKDGPGLWVDEQADATWYADSSAAEALGKALRRQGHTCYMDDWAHPDPDFEGCSLDQAPIPTTNGLGGEMLL